MLVSMEPVDDYAMTSDPASWADWLECVNDVGQKPLPETVKRPDPPR